MQKVFAQTLKIHFGYMFVFGICPSSLPTNLLTLLCFCHLVLDICVGFSFLLKAMAL